MKDIIKKAISHPKGKIKLAITDLDGVLRGKIVHKNKFESSIDNGFGFCNKCLKRRVICLISCEVQRYAGLKGDLEFA